MGATTYIIIGLVIALSIVGYLLLRSTKKTGALEDQNKNITATNNVVKKQVDIAAENVSAEDAYADLKGDKEKKG